MTHNNRREDRRRVSVQYVGPLAGLFFVLVGAMVTLAQTERLQTPINQEKANQLRKDLREMVTLARNRVFPSLVNIKVITSRYFGGKEQKGQAVGSGTIISRDGYVLTNFHVVDNGKKFKCTLANKQEITAKLIGEDPLTDLAILKLDLSELTAESQPLPFATFGDSDELQIGDTVMAMGSPWALSRSVTLGIVSNTERVLAATDDDAGEMRFNQDQRTGIFNRWIQHDAAINPGNSGGPLVNLKGELVGVNARGTFLGGNMGFAIPSNIASVVSAKLIEHGEVSRSWFGLSLKPIKKSGYKKGVLANSIVKDGPADKANLQAGDVILEIDGIAVNVWFPEEVPPILKRLADYPIGSSVAIRYQRKDKILSTEIVTKKLEKDRGDEEAFRGWGFVAMDITERMARERRLDSTDGVLVQSVRSGRPAQLAEPALGAGDVIRTIDGDPIPDLDALIKRYRSIMDSDELPEYLLIAFDRLGRSQLTLLKPKQDDDDDPPREVRKAWIGVAVQPVIKKLAKALGHETLGFRITRVYPRTLAADSELRIGDIITALNGKHLKPRGMQDAGLFHRMVRRLDIDDKVSLTVLRKGQEQELVLNLEHTRIAREEARRDRNRDFEITVRQITFFDRDDNRWDDEVKGVIIVNIERASWAQLGGLRPGDLIQRIDEHEIKKLAQYKEAMKEVMQRQPERVVFVVLRGVQTRYQFVEPDWNPGEDEESKADKDKE